MSIITGNSTRLLTSEDAIAIGHAERDGWYFKEIENQTYFIPPHTHTSMKNVHALHFTCVRCWSGKSFVTPWSLITSTYIKR